MLDTTEIKFTQSMYLQNVRTIYNLKNWFMLTLFVCVVCVSWNQYTFFILALATLDLCRVRGNPVCSGSTLWLLLLKITIAALLL